MSPCMSYPLASYVPTFLFERLEPETESWENMLN